MRKGAVALLAAALLVGLVAGGANAWIRSRMYDGYTPAGPWESFAGKGAWGFAVSSQEEELRAGELNGPATLVKDDRRVSWRATMSNNTNCKADVRITLDNPGVVTSVVWYLCVGTRTGSNGPSQKAPMVRIRTSAGGVKIQYNNDTNLGSRGWYCGEGTTDSAGGVVLFGTTRGVAVDNGVWHKVRLTSYTDGSWHFWVNDGNGTSELYGTLASGSTGSMINWGVPDRTANADLYTRYFYWGQGIGQIDPIPGAGESYDIGGVAVTATDNSATITWNTERATTINKVWYGTTFHTLNQSANAVWDTNRWKVQLNNLDYSQTYAFYCASTDSAGQEYDTGLYAFRTRTLPLAERLNNAGFESAIDHGFDYSAVARWDTTVYPWADVFAPTPSLTEDTQRWGRVYTDIDGQVNRSPLYWKMFPATGMGFSGTKIMSSTFRKFGTAGQKVSVTPGQWYRATVQFKGFGTSAYRLGRIMLDPNGDDAPGTYAAGNFTMDNDVFYGNCDSTSGAWQTVSVIGMAATPDASVFLQMDYDATPGKENWLEFDDVTFTPVSAPTSGCGQVKLSANIGDVVDLPGVVVTSGKRLAEAGVVIGYVEEADRSAGMRVVAEQGLWSFDLDLGSHVDVAGYLEKNADNELQVRAKVIKPLTGTDQLDPVGMTNKSAGGGQMGLQVGMDDGMGLNNVGLLVCVWGRVTALGDPDGDGNYSVFIDDGSNLEAGFDGTTDTCLGIEVRIPGLAGIDPSMFVPDRTYVSVRGISSTKLWDPDGNPGTNNSVQKRVIRIRNADDVDPVIP